MSNLRQLKVTFGSFDDLVERIGPGLSRTHLYAPTDEEIAGGTRVRLEIGTVRKGALIRGVAKVAGPGDAASEPGLHLHLIHLDPSSTRLVDSIVRGEIAGVSPGEDSGPSPFDIPSAVPSATPPADAPPPEEAPAPAAAAANPEPKEKSPLRIFAWPLVLAVLAGISLLLFTLITSREEDHRLLTGRDRQTEIVEPPAPSEPGTPDPAAERDTASPTGPQVPVEPPVEDEPSALNEPTTGAESPAEPPTAAVPAAPAEQAEEVAATVRAWAGAWSRQDPAAYIELYAPAYRSPGLDRDAWERQRRARIKAPERLEVSVSDIKVEILGPKSARARFHQLYATEDKALAARKILELERLATGWRIVAERVDQSSATP